MDPVATTCLRCGHAMEQGFLYNKGNDEDGFDSWIEGARQTSFWKGTSLKGRARFAITTYRCPRCGYLESRADQPWEE
jgi:hypothetical protein